MAVIHYPERARFEITTHSEAFVAYQLLANGAVDFTQTFVPFRLRGQGLAEELVTEALRWATLQGLSIQASCWYVAKYLPSNPQ